MRRNIATSHEQGPTLDTFVRFRATTTFRFCVIVRRAAGMRPRPEREGSARRRLTAATVPSLTMNGTVPSFPAPQYHRVAPGGRGHLAVADVRSTSLPLRDAAVMGTRPAMVLGIAHATVAADCRAAQMFAPARRRVYGVPFPVDVVPIVARVRLRRRRHAGHHQKRRCRPTDPHPPLQAGAPVLPQTLEPSTLLQSTPSAPSRARSLAAHSLGQPSQANCELASASLPTVAHRYTLPLAVQQHSPRSVVTAPRLPHGMILN